MKKLSDAIRAVLEIAKVMSTEYPSRKLSIVITKLEEALLWAEKED